MYMYSEPICVLRLPHVRVDLPAGVAEMFECEKELNNLSLQGWIRQ